MGRFVFARRLTAAGFGWPANAGGQTRLADLVETRGLEPLTFALQKRCATNCAISPGTGPRQDPAFRPRGPGDGLPARLTILSIRTPPVSEQPSGLDVVELLGVEPRTFCMPCRRATSCAITPYPAASRRGLSRKARGSNPVDGSPVVPDQQSGCHPVCLPSRKVPKHQCPPRDLNPDSLSREPLPQSWAIGPFG